MMGGAQVYSPASVDDNSMAGPSKMSLAQGGDYDNIHSAQHGGAAVTLTNSAPVGDTGMLDDSLRASARVTPLDESVGAIQGMSDSPQAGGRRRKGSKKASRRAKKSRKGSKKSSRRAKKSGSRRRRTMRGGSAYSLANAGDAAAPGLLLSPDQEAVALKGMHSDWRTAGDVTLYTPSRS